MGIKVGIDLGTTFSAVATLDKDEKPYIIPNEDGEELTPSVIQFSDKDGVLVGTQAKEAMRFGEPNCAAFFKRYIGSKDAYIQYQGRGYSALDLSTILLAHLKMHAEQVSHQTIDEAVITVPAYFTDVERDATMTAAKRAGLFVRQIINEPSAAVLTYCIDHWRDNAIIMVYDLGGGTFDVTLVQMGSNMQLRTLRTIGDHLLGGKDWDDRLADIIVHHVQQDTGISADDYPQIRDNAVECAEAVKMKLTFADKATVNLNIENYDKYSTVITRKEFADITSDLIEHTGELCGVILKDLNINWSDITDVLLVGGSTRMAQVPTYLEKISGHKPLRQLNPDTAVALGAAIQTKLALPAYISVTSDNDIKKPNAKVGAVVGTEKRISGAVSTIQCNEVVAHAMGIIVANKEGTEWINQIIIPANSSIPIKYAKGFHYYTSPNSEDNEQEIYVVQGSLPKPLDNKITAKYVVTGIQHDPSNNLTLMRIQYSYDYNGLIHIQARQGKSNVDLPIRKDELGDLSMFDRPIEKKIVKAVDLNVILAIDVSGSMVDAIRDAKLAMKGFVDQFKMYDGSLKIGVVAVGDFTLKVQNMTNDFNQCKHAINEIEVCCAGGGNSADPFDEISEMMSECDGKKYAIVLADGVWDFQDVAIAKAKKCNHQGIDTIGIGFGAADEEFLKDITNGDINSIYTAQSGLLQGFGKLAQQINDNSGNGNSVSDKKLTDESVVDTWKTENEK